MSQKGIKLHEKDQKSWYLHCSQKSGNNFKYFRVTPHILKRVKYDILR